MNKCRTYPSVLFKCPVRMMIETKNTALCTTQIHCTNSKISTSNKSAK